MTTNSELHRRRLEAIPRGIGTSFPIYVDRARNAELWDVEGRRYVDFAGGIAVLNTGHLHPRVQAAVAGQLERFSHTCFMVTPYEPAVTLAERLNSLAPGANPEEDCLLQLRGGGGRERGEGCSQLHRPARGHRLLRQFPWAHAYGARPDRQGPSLQGRLRAVSGKRLPRSLPLSVPGNEHGRRAGGHRSNLQGRHGARADGGDPDRTGPRRRWIHTRPFRLHHDRLRELCDRYGIVFVADEIQTGFGRTGRWFALDHAEHRARPHDHRQISGGGFPISALTGKAEIMDAPGPGGLGGTYGASPMSCAAALAVIEVIEEEGLIDRGAVDRWPCRQGH